jgi:Putative  PD-(D/E)XK family member, (DUF4420)
MKGEIFAEIGWDRLRSEASSSDLGVPSIEVPFDTGAGKARLALGDRGELRLLLPVAPGAPFPTLADSHGLELQDRMLLLRGRPTRFIDLTCRDVALDEVFQKLVADILRRLDGDGAPAGSIEGAITDFRSLLLGARHSRPTVESALGLIGELLVLNLLLARSPGAWRCWTGPTGARHDFRGGIVAIEAKTTLRAQKRTIEISALDQLLEPDGGELLLAHQVLEYDAGGHLTVADQADRALKMADDQNGLSDMLAEAGYIPEFRARWDAFRFSLLSTDHYTVDGRFPRLVPASFREGDLPLGVSHFRYRVDLDFAVDNRVVGDELEHLLGRIVE